MRNLILFGLLIPRLAAGQFADDFSDGDFINNPAWTGDTAAFVITNVSGDNKLRSNSATASSSFYLSTPSSLVNNCQWEFWVNLAFNTSGANYVDVYLTSDSANLKASNNNGYYVRIGNTADEISLYKKVGGTSTRIIDGVDGVTNISNNILKIRVTRDSSNLWKLERDVTGSGSSYFTEGTVVDSDVLSSSYFGIFIQQSTASFFQKHFFDDFSAGAIAGDTAAPVIDSINVTSNITLDLMFNEPLDKISSENISNYLVNNGIGNPATAMRDDSDSSIVHVTFSNTFQNGVTNMLTITSITDLSGNAITVASKDFLYFIPDTAVLNDVIISEIFPDPEPSVGLPDAEFVELYNRSAKVFDLKGWTFSDGTTTASLGNSILAPNGYLILCSASNVGLFSGFGNTLGVGTLPSLNNDGDELSLKDASGKMIFYIHYSDSWYRDAIKKDGGWSLEMIDADNPCRGTDNWKASNDVRGGTPGQVNSVNGINPDETAPSLNYTLVTDSLTLLLDFNETLDSASPTTVTNYSIDNGISIAGLSFTNASLGEIAVRLANPLQHNILYTITINSVSDCSGNVIGVANTAQFGLSEQPDSFDIVINEILPNPVPGGSDFIELYNRSQKIIDLKDLIIASIDEDDGDTSIAALPTFLLLPGSYVALTGDARSIITQYHPPNSKLVIEVNAMPAFDDDEDIVVLFNRLNNNSVIDAVHYYSDWNFALLDNTEGVSLERINYNSASQDQNNWHSAASTAGYATPAYQNSQFGEIASATSIITVEPKTFSPDNDGYHDLLNIHYKLDHPGYVASVNIYDDKGRKIHDLVNNRMLGIEGNLVWDGINDDGTRAHIGVYIIMVELFDLSGDRHRFKESCVLAAKL